MSCINCSLSKLVSLCVVLTCPSNSYSCFTLSQSFNHVVDKSGLQVLHLKLHKLLSLSSSWILYMTMIHIHLGSYAFYVRSCFVAYSLNCGSSSFQRLKNSCLGLSPFSSCLRNVCCSNVVLYCSMLFQTLCP